MNKHFVFLLAWVSGSDSACGEDTKIKSQDDLMTEFLNRNPNIFAVEIYAENEEIAYAYGIKEAFFNNYTAHDSVSICEEWDKSYDPPGHLKRILASYDRNAKVMTEREFNLSTNKKKKGKNK